MRNVSNECIHQLIQRKKPTGVMPEEVQAQTSRRYITAANVVIDSCEEARVVFLINF